MHGHTCLCVVKAQQEERQKNYTELLATEEQNLIPNSTEIECPICFSTIQPGEGAVLRECLHAFCRSDPLKTSAVNTSCVQTSFFIVTHCALFNRDCLTQTIVNSRDAEVACPEACESQLQDREIKAVIVTLFPHKSCMNVANVILVTVNRCFTAVAAAE